MKYIKIKKDEISPQSAFWYFKKIIKIIKIMKTTRDTELKYVNGNKILEGDIVEFEWYQFGAVPEKIKCVVTYKNAAFYIESELIMNGKPAIEKTIASILENNAKIPDNYPMNITKVTPQL